jgi:hypothetical protein
MKSISYRHAMTVAISVYIAFMLQYIYSFSSEYWLVLSAFFVSQTTRGTPFKQGMLIFLVMVAAIIVSGLLSMNIKSFAIFYLVLSIIFMGNSYWAFMARPQSSKAYFITMLFAITVLIAAYSPRVSVDMMSNRIFDTAIGALIAILCRMLISPMKWDVEFSEGIRPILDALQEYAGSMPDDKTRVEKRLQVESALLQMYPSWIYEAGFNRGLRSGFRFFLIHVEQVAEVLFSMEDILSRGEDNNVMQDFKHIIEPAMQKNQELLSMLSGYFMKGCMSDHDSDFTSDIMELEKAVQRIMPESIEFLVVSRTALLLAAWVQDVKDMRQLLLKLVMALPVKDDVVLLQEKSA